MMKKFLLLCFVALLSGFAHAQNTRWQDAVYMKNGSVVRGTIIEQVPGKSLKIETRDGNVFVYKMAEVNKITREQMQNQFGNTNRFTAKPKGYGGLVEAGYGIGVSGYGSKFEFDVVNGYQFSPYFYMGFGVGVNVWTNGSGLVSLPLFAHFRTNFMNKPVSPFFALSAGYNLSVTSGIDGGIMIEPTLGVTFRTSNRTAVIFGIGYSGQQYKEEYFYYGSYTEKYWTSAIRLKLGFTF
ncbi:MAG: hypothetical protein J1E79_05920 [Rikenella sp.]|nr:hypothetical protein [Rikenella sp.]